MEFPSTVEDLIAACEARNPKGESTTTARAVNGDLYILLDAGGVHKDGALRPACFSSLEHACKAFWCIYCMMVPPGATVYWRRQIGSVSGPIGNGKDAMTVYGVNARLTWDK